LRNWSTDVFGTGIMSLRIEGKILISPGPPLVPERQHRQLPRGRKPDHVEPAQRCGVWFDGLHVVEGTDLIGSDLDLDGSKGLAAIVELRVEDMWSIRVR